MRWWLDRVAWLDLRQRHELKRDGYDGGTAPLPVATTLASRRAAPALLRHRRNAWTSSINWRTVSEDSLEGARVGAGLAVSSLGRSKNTPEVRVPARS